MKNRELYKNL